MRLVCPNCDAKYEVPDNAIPDVGRDVQCANCNHAWFQMKPSKGAAAIAAASVAPVADPKPEVAPAATPAPAYAVDDSVLAILREEAERELTARQSTAKPAEVATVPVIAPAAPTAAEKRTAMLRGEDLEEASSKPSARRDLLPDVEEINSTLRPSDKPADADADVGADEVLVRGRSSFRSGFLMMMTVAIIGLVAYITAPQLASQVPALKEPLMSYVGFVDMMRLQLDGLMQSATVAINGDG